MLPSRPFFHAKSTPKVDCFEGAFITIVYYFILAIPLLSLNMVIPRAEASPISTAYESPETWTEIKLVKGESSWTVYANGLEKGQIVLTNLKDDFFVQLGDATVYISELLGLPIEANA